MADKSNDPVAMWQNMIGEMEKGFNSFANQAMASPEFSKVVNQVGGVTAPGQGQLDLVHGELQVLGPPQQQRIADGPVPHLADHVGAGIAPAVGPHPGAIPHL